MTTFSRDMMHVMTCASLLVGSYAGTAAAAAPCPDNGSILQANCTKEIRIWNNTPGPIYAVLVGVPQEAAALNCPFKTGGGDVWLQAAFGDDTECYAVENTYYVFINPTTGIAAAGLAQYEDDYVADPTVRALPARVVFEEDPGAAVEVGDRDAAVAPPDTTHYAKGADKRRDPLSAGNVAAVMPIAVSAQTASG